MVDPILSWNILAKQADIKCMHSSWRFVQVLRYGSGHSVHLRVIEEPELNELSHFLLVDCSSWHCFFDGYASWRKCAFNGYVLIVVSCCGRFGIAPFLYLKLLRIIARYNPSLTLCFLFYIPVSKVKLLCIGRLYRPKAVSFFSFNLTPYAPDPRLCILGEVWNTSLAENVSVVTL